MLFQKIGVGMHNYQHVNMLRVWVEFDCSLQKNCNWKCKFATGNRN